MICFVFFDHALKVFTSFDRFQFNFLFKNVFEDLGIGIGVTEGETHTVIIMLKLNLKPKTVIVENFFFPDGALSTEGSHLSIWALPHLGHCRLLSKLLFNLLFLVTISAGSQHVFFPSLNPWLNELELIGADSTPFLAPKFWLVNHSLIQFRFARHRRPGDTRFSEVFYVKLVLSSLPCVSDSEIKPLLMPLSIRIHLHVHVVFFRGYPICLQQVARLSHAIKKKNVFSIPLVNPLLRFLVLIEIFNKFSRKIPHFSASKNVAWLSKNILVNIISCYVIKRFTDDRRYGICLCCLLHVLNSSCWLLRLSNVVLSNLISLVECDLLVFAHTEQRVLSKFLDVARMVLLIDNVRKTFLIVRLQWFIHSWHSSIFGTLDVAVDLVMEKVLKELVFIKDLKVL